MYYLPILLPFLVGSIYLLVWWFSAKNQLPKIIDKIRSEKIFVVETTTYILRISKNKEEPCHFKNKKTGWENDLSRANSRTIDPLYKELREWYDDKQINTENF